MIQSLTTGGSAIGALFSGPLASYGRWKCLIICNIIAIVGAIMTLFFEIFPLLCTGRLLFGIAAGGYTVFCPKFISEVSPKEVSGPAGAMF